jgi:hypothetical protein
MSQTLASSRPGMGAMPFSGGVTIRDRDPRACPLAPEEGGTRSADVTDARTGDEYRFLVRAGGQELRGATARTPRAVCGAPASRCITAAG